MGLIRRRGLLTLGESDIDWDLEWDYTMGLLENNGWTKETSGTASSAMQTGGQRIQSAMNSWIRLNPPSAYTAITSGVMEIVASCAYTTGYPGSQPVAASQNLRICLSNGTNGIQTLVNGGNGGASTGVGLKIMDNGTPYLCTLISPWVSGAEHTVRLILNNGIGEVWVDGTKVVGSVNASSILYATATRIWSQNSNNQPTILKSVKLKKYS